MKPFIGCPAFSVLEMRCLKPGVFHNTLFLFLLQTLCTDKPDQVLFRFALPFAELRWTVLCLDVTAAVWNSPCQFLTSLVCNWLGSAYLGIKNQESWTVLLESLPKQRVKCSGLSPVSSSLYLRVVSLPDWLLPAPDVPGAWGDGGYRGDR